MSSWPVDSVIHALGSVRKTAGTQLNSAAVIVTTKHSFSFEWQPWSLSQNFWFYDELIRKYEPTVIAPTTVVWERRAQERLAPEVSYSIYNNGRGFTVQGEISKFYKVKLSLQSSGTGRHLFKIRNNISYGVDANGYVFVAPYSTEVQFPVLIKRDQELFEPEVTGSDRVSYVILDCKAAEITPRNQDIFGEGSTPSTQ